MWEQPDHHYEGIFPYSLLVQTRILQGAYWEVQFVSTEQVLCWVDQLILKVPLEHCQHGRFNKCRQLYMSSRILYRFCTNMSKVPSGVLLYQGAIYTMSSFLNLIPWILTLGRMFVYNRLHKGQYRGM